jgi:hypothetical protein
MTQSGSWPCCSKRAVADDVEPATFEEEPRSFLQVGNACPIRGRTSVYVFAALRTLC